MDTKILQEALKSIREFGWVQDEYGLAGKPQCITGALNTAAKALLADRSDMLNAVHRLHKVVGTPHLLTWNDAPDRTKADIEAALERALTV